MRKSTSYLLDTNIFLWWLDDVKQLKEFVRQIIENRRNKIYISIASAWEISIKNKIGKLPLKAGLKQIFKSPDFELLNVDLNHILALDKLPLLHRDPFDRLLVSQAKMEKFTLITSDPKIKMYRVNLLLV